MKKEPKKYVVVLAHGDGWGALSANKFLSYLHRYHSDVGVHLIVSQATKNKEGRIVTKIDALEAVRELKETNLQDYFRQIDVSYNSVDSTLNGAMPPKEGERLQTFKQLARRVCADQEVHYTSCGGKIGGEEAQAVVRRLETQYGHGPEVLLSLDTMAILPGTLLNDYPCISAHPGPLDSIKVEGMQASLRSLVNQVYYYEDGTPVSENDPFFGVGGDSYIKGTLFLQHEELDKGPPIATVTSWVPRGMSAYESRDALYSKLIDKMIELTPKLLDRTDRDALIDVAQKKMEEEASLTKEHVDVLDAEQLQKWQSKYSLYSDETHGNSIVPNQIVDPEYFKHTMRLYYPGDDAGFERLYTQVFGATVERLNDESNATRPPHVRYLMDRDKWWSEFLERDKNLKELHEKLPSPRR